METSNPKSVDLALQIKKESTGQLGKSGGSTDVFTANSREMENPSSNNESAIGVSNPFLVKAVYSRSKARCPKGTTAQKDAAAWFVLNSKTLREAETLVKVHCPVICSNMRFMTWMYKQFPNADYTPRRLEDFLPEYRRFPQSMLDVMNSRAIFISGKSGIGKTDWIRAMYPRYLYATTEADLKAFVCGVHEGIIFDGLQPKSLKYDNLLALMSIGSSMSFKIRNKLVFLPAQLPRVAISNLAKENFITAVAELHKELEIGGYNIADKFRWRIVELQMKSKLW